MQTTKAVLKDFRATKTITLPGYENSQVTVYDSLLMRDYAEIEGFLADQKPEGMIKALSFFIQSWNFTDEAGKDLPINEENIGKLSVEAITALTDATADLVKSKKKE